MRTSLRIVVALILLADAAVSLRVAAGLLSSLPGWVALHYAPTDAADACELAVARLRAELRQSRHREPDAAEEALLAELRASANCDPGSRDLVRVEARLRALAAP